jgi:putative DNA primase/helicase
MSDPFKPIDADQSQTKNNDREWTPIVPVPLDAPAPPDRHPTLGAPTEIYPYIAASGETNGFVWRVDRHGGKEYRPLTFCLHPKGFVRDWRWQTWPKPRPLFNADQLYRRAGAPVLIVEGERCCRAAEGLAPGHVSITSPGGAKAGNQADWGALAKREVVIWPDNDEAGRLYAATVAKHAIAAGATRVSIINPPPGVPATWDVHDALVAGYDETQTNRLIASAVPADAVELGAAGTDDRDSRSRKRRTPQRDEVLTHLQRKWLSKRMSLRWLWPVSFAIPPPELGRGHHRNCSSSSTSMPRKHNAS